MSEVVAVLDSLMNIIDTDWPVAYIEINTPCVCVTTTWGAISNSQEKKYIDKNTI